MNRVTSTCVGGSDFSMKTSSYYRNCLRRNGSSGVDFELLQRDSEMSERWLNSKLTLICLKHFPESASRFLQCLRNFRPLPHRTVWPQWGFGLARKTFQPRFEWSQNWICSIISASESVEGFCPTSGIFNLLQMYSFCHGMILHGVEPQQISICPRFSLRDKSSSLRVTQLPFYRVFL